MSSLILKNPAVWIVINKILHCKCEQFCMQSYTCNAILLTINVLKQRNHLHDLDIMGRFYTHSVWLVGKERQHSNHAHSDKGRLRFSRHLLDTDRYDRNQYYRWILQEIYFITPPRHPRDAIRTEHLGQDTVVGSGSHSQESPKKHCFTRTCEDQLQWKERHISSLIEKEAGNVVDSLSMTT